jgi:hypothetical protein
LGGAEAMPEIVLEQLLVLVVEPSLTQRRSICRALESHGIRSTDKTSSSPMTTCRA